MMTWMAPTNSAPISRKSPASELITTISESALLIGCFCTSRLTAPATHPAAKIKKRISCNMLLYGRPRASLTSERYHQRRDHDVGQRKRQQELPAERHQLVIAEARQRTAHPDVNEKEGHHARHEVQHWQQRLQNRR